MEKSAAGGRALAILPARGGSKRIPRKNVKLFAGKPMIAWPIGAALASGLFDDVIVSTDDAEIAATAQAEGARAPFVRPDDLADDHTPLRPVLQHAIAAMEADSGARYDFVCSILATAALIAPEDLQAAARRQAETGADFVLGAARFASPIQRAFTMTAGGGLEMREPEHRLTRSQDLPECYHDAGQFYWGRRDAFMDGLSMYGPGTRAILLPPERAVDVDTPEDWDRIERLVRAGL